MTTFTASWFSGFASSTTSSSSRSPSRRMSTTPSAMPTISWSSVRRRWGEQPKGQGEQHEGRHHDYDDEPVEEVHRVLHPFEPLRLEHHELPPIVGYVETGGVLDLLDRVLGHVVDGERGQVDGSTEDLRRRLADLCQHSVQHRDEVEHDLAVFDLQVACVALEHGDDTRRAHAG